MEHLITTENIIALITLTFLEIVLGIDNIIFISIVTSKLPPQQQPKARYIGLSLAMIFRVVLLMGIAYITRLTAPTFSLPFVDLMNRMGMPHAHETAAISGRDLILLGGGLFLIAKSTSEMHGKLTGHQAHQKNSKVNTLAYVLIQIILIDIIFSFDSILTAIGLSDQIPIMVTAIIISIAVMMLFSGPISTFVNKHITLQMLALAFLILIGFMLVVEAFNYHVPKGYIYFALAFSLAVEIVNMRVRQLYK
jgi:predicted tellurium resistance membrane protein TerC